MKTEVTELLGIEYPIIQGGMAWVAEYHLAAGVSNAGGLGLIGAASAPAEWVREQIRSARKLTDRPFGVNIMLMSPYADEVAKVIVEEGVKVVTTGAGSPEKYMQMWKEAGVKVIPVVASTALARRMERCGADAVVAEGCEAGGHIGENTTMVLVPQIVDALKIPVIAAGVSNAGGLGLIGAASAPAEWVREQIRSARKLTDRPFGVNIMLMSPYADEVAKVIVEEGVKVVTTGAGSPEKYMQMWKEAGVKVIPVVASTALARRMERCGADAVVAEGCEAGGHIGENTTMVLVPQIVDALKIPVIAAGGIADGRGMAAAFMLGAKAVQLGTVFVTTEESQVHENYKKAIIKAKDIDSRVTGRTTGHPVRALRNQMTKKYLELEKSGAGFEELELLTLGGLRKAVVEGDVVNGSVMAGQSAAMVKEVMNCHDLIRKLARETEECFGRKYYE